jgi:hypothetical protein
MLRRIFGSRRDEVLLYGEEHRKIYNSRNKIGVLKSSGLDIGILWESQNQRDN